MRQLIEALSWSSGFFVVAAVSAVFALFTGRLQPAALRWSSCIIVPASVSYCLYWSPAWLGAEYSVSEHSSWSGAFLFPWSLVGAFASIAVTICVNQHLKARHAQDG